MECGPNGTALAGATGAKHPCAFLRTAPAARLLRSRGTRPWRQGAALGRGCTSGQALTGGAMLVTGSLLFLGAMFAGGYAVAWFVRRQWQ